MFLKKSFRCCSEVIGRTFLGLWGWYFGPKVRAPQLVLHFWASSLSLPLTSPFLFSKSTIVIPSLLLCSASIPRNVFIQVTQRWYINLLVPATCSRSRIWGEKDCHRVLETAIHGTGDQESVPTHCTVHLLLFGSFYRVAYMMDV